MSLTSAKSLCAVASEATYGTDAIAPGPPSAYQAFRSLLIDPILNQIESPRETWTNSGEKSCGVKSHNNVTFEMPFTGRVGDAGSEPAWGPLLEACGFKKTVVAATSVTYKPSTSQAQADTPSCTLWQYLRQLEIAEAYLLKARGFRGNATIRLTVGDEAVIAGQGLALYDAWPTSDISAPTPPSSYEGATCMVVQGLALTMGAVTYPCESLEINTNWALTEIRTGEAGAGTLSKVVATRPSSGGRLNGSINLVDGTTALQDLITKWQSGTQVSLSATLTDGTRTITITAPAVQFGQPAGSRDGVLKFAVPISFNRGSSAGDDELSIACT